MDFSKFTENLDTRPFKSEKQETFGGNKNHNIMRTLISNIVPDGHWSEHDRGHEFTCIPNPHYERTVKIVDPDRDGDWSIGNSNYHFVGTFEEVLKILVSIATNSQDNASANKIMQGAKVKVRSEYDDDMDDRF